MRETITEVVSGRDGRRYVVEAAPCPWCLGREPGESEGDWHRTPGSVWASAYQRLRGRPHWLVEIHELEDGAGRRGARLASEVAVHRPAAVELARRWVVELAGTPAPQRLQPPT